MFILIMCRKKLRIDVELSERSQYGPRITYSESQKLDDKDFENNTKDMDPKSDTIRTTYLKFIENEAFEI